MSYIRTFLIYLISYLVFLISLLRTMLSSSLILHFFAHPLRKSISLFNPQSKLSPVLIPHNIPFTLFWDIAIMVITYTWTIFFTYPAYLALVGFGWAMQPFEPDAVDLSLSIGLG